MGESVYRESLEYWTWYFVKSASLMTACWCPLSESNSNIAGTMLQPNCSVWERSKDHNVLSQPCSPWTWSMYSTSVLTVNHDAQFKTQSQNWFRNCIDGTLKIAHFKNCAYCVHNLTGKLFREAIDNTRLNFHGSIFMMVFKRQSNIKTSDSKWNTTKWTENSKRWNIHRVFMLKILEKFAHVSKMNQNYKQRLQINRHFIAPDWNVQHEIVTAPIFFTCFQFWKWIVSQNSISIFPIFKSKPYFLKEKQSGIYRLAIS